LEGFLNQDWVKIISNANLTHWKEALAALLTYTGGEALVQLCNMLGQRLEDEAGNEPSRLYFACICYICSADLNNLVKIWFKIKTLNKENSGEYSAILKVKFQIDSKIKY
jgi:protein transport protein SEC31